MNSTSKTSSGIAAFDLADSPADRSPRSREVGSGARVAMLLTVALLLCLRMPDILIKGRLWAEEGYFYQSAWFMPFWQALFHGYGGYLNLVANAAGLAARYAVPLSAAPWVTTGIGLAFQLTPAVLIVSSRAPWLRSPLAMGAALLVLVTIPATAEVWLQTLHSQYHLALCVALIMAFDVTETKGDAAGPAQRWFRRALLLLAPLSGLPSVLLLPLMVARTMLDRSRERVIQCCLLAAGSLVQVGLFYSPSAGAALGRSAGVWPGALLYTVFIRHVWLPLVGESWAERTGDGIARAVMSGHHPLAPLVAVAVAGAVVGAFAAARWRSGAPWLLGAAVLIAGASYYGAINGGLSLVHPAWGERYTFMPQVLLEWTLICLAASVPQGWMSRLAGTAAAWMIAVGAIGSIGPTNAYFSAGPDWREEVRAWQADPSHLIRLWPDRWSMQLTPDHSPVSARVKPP